MAMSTSRLLLMLLPCLAVVTADRSLSIMLMHLENIQGVTENGTQCSPFYFAGVQCSMEMEICVEIGDKDDETTCYSLGQISHGSNKIDFTVISYGNWSNPLVISLENITYEGFKLHVNLNDVISGEPIDEWNATFANASQLQDIYTYTSHRDGSLGTSLTVAWTTNEVDPPTPPPTTVPTTTITQPSTTQGDVEFPRTCDEFWNRTDGVKTIWINNNSINVYCQYGSSGAYTIIQSRGSNDDTSFDLDIEGYKKPFGIPGKGNNFWLGLDNMVALTADDDYDLLIELCCAKNNSIQFYRHLKITEDYILQADPVVPGIGLDFTSSNTGKKDLGVPFTTYKKMSDTMRDSCDIVRYYYGNYPNPIFDLGTGGWWYGSCGNNLNGQIVPYSATSQCHLEETFPQGTAGIEMRTTPGMYHIGGDFRSFDGISYDRVRMAIYRSGQTPIATSPFCG